MFLVLLSILPLQQSNNFMLQMQTEQQTATDLQTKLTWVVNLSVGSYCPQSPPSFMIITQTGYAT